MLEPYPAADSLPLDADAEEELAWIQSVVLAIRQIRGEMDIPPGKRLPVLHQDAGTSDRERLGTHDRYLRELARLESITELTAGAPAPAAAISLVGNMKLLVPIAGLIDVAAERARLQKTRQKTVADLERVNAKLGTETFVANAPEAVVQKERDRAANLERDLRKLDEQLTKLAAV
jgi:valyl-tRNA synthetase